MQESGQRGGSTCGAPRSISRGRSVYWKSSWTARSTAMWKFRVPRSTIFWYFSNFVIPPWQTQMKYRFGPWVTSLADRRNIIQSGKEMLIHCGHSIEHHFVNMFCSRGGQIYRNVLRETRPSHLKDLKVCHGKVPLQKWFGVSCLQHPCSHHLCGQLLQFAQKLITELS